MTAMRESAATLRSSMEGRIREFAAAGGMVWAIVMAIIIAAAILSEDFRTLTNLSNLSRQNVVLSLVAAAQFCVVLTAGVDLSLGAIVKITSIAAAMTMQRSDAWLVPGLALAFAIGALAGALNGFIVTRLKVPPFIATLGTLAVIRGISLFVASTPKGRASPILGDFYSWQIGPVLVVVVLAAAVWVVLWVLLNRTAWGRHVYAVGGDPRVARLSGLHTERVQFSVYVLAGLLAALGGIVTLAGSGVGDPNAGLGLEFESLAAVVIGGASLFGGRGKLQGALGGVLLLGILRNTFNLLSVSVWYQQLIKGIIILVAAAIYVQKKSSVASGR